MKILIIDNEMVRLRNLRSILSSLGYRSGDIDSTEDPTNGLGTMKKKAFDLVFVYDDLGKKKALDVVKEMRANQRLKRTPVVIYSAKVSKDKIMESVKGGANGFLGYPFSVSDVEAAMEQAKKK